MTLKTRNYGINSLAVALLDVADGNSVSIAHAHLTPSSVNPSSSNNSNNNTILTGANSNDNNGFVSGPTQLQGTPATAAVAAGYVSVPSSSSLSGLVENSNSSSDFNFLSNLANDFAPEYYQLS